MARPQGPAASLVPELTMDISKIPPVSRRLDYVLQALEDICKKLDQANETLAVLKEKTFESLAPRALLSVKQAAARLGVGPGTMRSLAGREIAYVKIGSRTSFAPEDIDRFIARNRRDWGSSRWMGKGRHRYGSDEKADQKYLERISRPDPSETMPPLEPNFDAALVAHGVNKSARRALRLAGIVSIAKAQTFSYDELLSVRGLGINTAPYVLKAVGKPVPKGCDPDNDFR
jgi:hypothetical protein